MTRVEEFAEHRDYLVGIAYRMLGSFDEAEDVVQDARLRAERTESSDIEEPRAWRTAVFAFVVRQGRIAQIDVVANPDKLRRVPSA